MKSLTALAFSPMKVADAVCSAFTSVAEAFVSEKPRM